MSVSGLSITPCTFTSSAYSTPPAMPPAPDVPRLPQSTPLAPVQAQNSLADSTQRHDQLRSEFELSSDSHSAVEISDNDHTDLSVVTQQINEFMRGMNRQLSFHLDEDLNRQVVSVVDRESGDVIRQLPSEEMLELAKKMADQMAGILLKTEV
ncbi:flagellar protein FlaG [Plesiomonas shigelloides]|uniref:flagellar protein FlaG n=1 Tax=Plesiomonas shigelloides TaxID=703 RepID=UPI00126183AA|nr:flagellar protein FlaG [Plesiomonas shigelloides]KAB7684575.1 hypothetical protein GBN20_14780 [Plesiomonas shigelloides]